MATIGQFNELIVLRRTAPGLFLDGQELGDILLPKRYVTDSMQVGDTLRVFLYHDSNDYLVATTETPKALAEHCAYLTVAAVNRTGAFMDWGLPKDLLVPYSEQHVPMKVGRGYVVYVYVDQVTQRLVATTRLHKVLLEAGKHFSAGDRVQLLICGHSELGFKAVINDTHLGLIHQSDALQRLHTGQQITGYIKQIRSDQRIDLTLQAPDDASRSGLRERILAFLRSQGGSSTLTDRSSPEDIYATFQVSKANYKKALGALYKERLISLSKDQIRLSDDQE